MRGTGRGVQAAQTESLDQCPADIMYHTHHHHYHDHHYVKSQAVHMLACMRTARPSCSTALIVMIIFLEYDY